MGEHTSLPTVCLSLLPTNFVFEFQIIIIPVFYGLIYAVLSVYLQSFTLSVSLMQAQASGHGNSVCTLYELHSGEDTTEEGKTNTSYVLLSVFYIHWTNMTVTLRGFNMDVNRK